MIPDANLADAVVVRVVASVAVVILACLGIWVRFYKSRTTVSTENGERIRFEDAIRDAQEARKEAHSANNLVMSFQRQLGRLEAENEACNARADRQDIEISALKVQNARQGEQIDALMRKKTVDPRASDFQ